MPAPEGPHISVWPRSDTCKFTRNGVAPVVAAKRRGGLCFGISLDMLPELYGNVPDWLGPLFGSSLTLATVVAVVLHQLLGMKRLVAERYSRLTATASEPAVEASASGSQAARRSGTDG